MIPAVLQFSKWKSASEFTTASSPQQIWPPYSFQLLSGPALSFVAHSLHIGVGRFDRLF